MKIFIGSLPFKTMEEEVRTQFEKFGEVSSVKIITDKYSGRSRGFGFVEMPNDEDASKAIENLNGADVGGRKIVVNQAEERERREGGGGGGGNRFDRPRGGNREY